MIVCQFVIPTIFLKYLPDQLEHFYLRMSSFNLYQWVEKVGDFYAAQFMNRFSRLRTFDIYFADLVMAYNVEPSTVSCITTCFSLVHALVGNRDTYCSFVGNYLKTRSYRFTYDSNNTLTLDYGVISELDLFVNRDNKGELRLPDKLVSIIGFEIINRFMLHFSSEQGFEDLPDEDLYDLPRIILECALLNCPNLDHFEVEMGPHFHKINVGPRLGVNVSKSHNNGHEYLKVAKLQNVFDHSKVLESLVTYLPYIEVLSIDYFLVLGCDRYNNFCDYDFDLTGFASLEYFYFYAGIRDNIDVTFAIYHFKYSDGDEKKHCYSTAERRIIPFENFDSKSENVEVITIKADKSVQVILCNNLFNIALGIFENGNFLNLDYPIIMEPYQDY